MGAIGWGLEPYTVVVRPYVCVPDIIVIESRLGGWQQQMVMMIISFSFYHCQPN